VVNSGEHADAATNDKHGAARAGLRRTAKKTQGINRGESDWHRGTAANGGQLAKALLRERTTGFADQQSGELAAIGGGTPVPVGHFRLGRGL